MAPIQIFKECIRILRWVCKLLHRDIFEKKMKLSKWSLLIIFLLTSFMFCCVYTAFNDELSIAFLAIVALIATFQTFAKYMLCADLHRFIEVLNYILDFHRKNSNQDERVYLLCKRYATFSRFFAIMFTILCAVVLQIYQSPKYYHFFTSGEIVPSMGIYVPFVEDLEGGVELIQAYNMIMGITLGFLFSGFDAVIYLVFGNMTIIPTILKRDLDDLRIILEKPEGSLYEVRVKLRDIIFMHKMYNQNIKKLDKGFQKICFLQIATATIGGVFTIYLAVSYNMVEGYTVTTTALLQIMTYCCLGTIIEISSTRILDAISSFEWYLLPHRERKIYHLFLHQAQQEQILYIAKITPLNMEASLQILKAIYSYAMFLKSSV